MFLSFGLMILLQCTSSSVCYESKVCQNLSVCVFYNFSYNTVSIACTKKYSNIALSDLIELATVPSQYIIVVQNHNYSFVDRIFNDGQMVNITNLNLVSNNIYHISDNLLANINGLDKLFLYENKLANLSFLNTPSVSSITSIDLSMNSLTWLDKAWFKYSSSLKILNLKSNLLNRLDSDTFVCLSNLETLDLGRNKLSVLVRHVFRNLSKLAYLDLDGNYLTNIETLAFYDCVSLIGRFEGYPVLALSRQSILSLEPRTFANLNKTTNLFIEKNILSRIENMTFYGLSECLSLNLGENYISFIDVDGFDSSLAEKLLVLNLSSNSIVQVNRTTFANLKSLRVLSMQNNKINMIESFSFMSLASTLTTLNLGSNKLGDIRKNHISYLVALNKLHLDSNQISTIEANTFSNLKNLTWLDVSKNCIYGIRFDLFKGLTLLNYLSLSKNLIPLLANNTFASQTNLTSLDLSYNLIDKIPNNIFAKLSSLVTLNLSNNRLDILNNSQSFAGLTKLTTLRLSSNFIKQLTSASFTGIGAQTLKWLYLDNNPIDSAKSTQLTFRSLNALDLSSCTQLNDVSLLPTSYAYSLDLSLNSMPPMFIQKWWSSLSSTLASRITRLDMSMNDLSKINVSFDYLFFSRLSCLILKNANLAMSTSKFDGGPFLTEIDLSDNPRLTHGPNFLFRSYLTLRKMVLSNTGLRDVEILNLTSFSLLTDIDLSRNELEVLSPSRFAQINIIKSLNLSFNRIKLIDSNFLLVYFELMDLSNNNIEEISVTYSSYNNIKPFVSIYISNNKLRHFSLKSSQIDKIDLSGNYLKEIPSDIKTSIEGVSHAITDFDLSSNLLSRVTNDSFTKCRLILSISLAHNSISDIEDNTFADLSNLLVLDLRNNSIIQVNGNKFNGLISLQYLYLSLNKIESFHEDTFSSLKKLNLLDLNRNKIKFIPDYLFSPLRVLVNLYANPIGMDVISNATFTGLVSIKTLETDQHLLNNPINVNELIESLQRKHVKKDAYIRWYQAIFVSFSQKKEYTDYYCSLIIYFARANLLLNFQTYSHITEFLNNCIPKEIANLNYQNVNLTIDFLYI